MADDQRTFAFNGALTDKGEAPFAAMVRFVQRDPTSLSISLVWHGGQKEAHHAAQGLRVLMQRNHLWLYATEKDHPSIEVLGWTGAHSRGQLTVLDAQAIEVGVSWTPAGAEKRFRVTAHLQPSGILSRTAFNSINKSTGHVRTHYLRPGQIAFDTKFGRLYAQQSEVHESGIQFGDKVLHVVQRATLTGDLAVSGLVSLHEAHEQLRKELDECCSILSLCFRQPIRYYELRYLEYREDGGWGSEALYRGRWTRVRESTGVEVVIHADQLVNRGLQRLLAAARASTNRDALFRSIQFLASSHDPPNLEVAFFMAFASMETLLVALPSKRSTQQISASQWRTVRHRLKKVMTEYAATSGADLTNEMKRLPLLQAASLMNRIQSAVKRWKPETEDLWPKVGFEKGMTRAAKLRNDLVHSAKADDALYPELVRVRTFTERLILKLLRWRDNRLWVWRDDTLGRINHP